MTRLNIPLLYAKILTNKISYLGTYGWSTRRTTFHGEEVITTAVHDLAFHPGEEAEALAKEKADEFWNTRLADVDRLAREYGLRAVRTFRVLKGKRFAPYAGIVESVIRVHNADSEAVKGGVA